MKALKNERLLFSGTITLLSCQAMRSLSALLFERFLSNGLHVLLDVLGITLFLAFNFLEFPLIRPFNFYTRIHDLEQARPIGYVSFYLLRNHAYALLTNLILKGLRMPSDT